MLMFEFSERKVTKKSEECEVKSEEFAAANVLFYIYLQWQQAPYLILPNSLFIFHFPLLV